MSRPFLALLSSLALFAAPLAVFAQEGAAPAAAPQAPAGIMLVDLRGETVPAYPYESWGDRLGRTPNGVQVLGAKGALGNGGFCGTLPAETDLSGMTYVDVALAVGQTNEVPEVTVVLADADGTMASGRIGITQIVPGQSVWFRVPLASLQPSTDPKYAGKVPGLDLAKITQWHLQGDWATKKPCQILFIAIRAHR